MLSCREVTEQASDYLESTLPWQQRLGIRLHLFLCRHCRRYLRQLRAVTIAFRQMPRPEIPEEVMDKQIDRLRAYFLQPEDGIKKMD
ncbi:zf-HC2 domain-containing protein [Nitrosococcus wardiae]|uniref:Zf-HC2 domain-containing protein n=1 Tax=Nitrosococcus wardiae TaxID=1814290 RepID=A0A4P7C0R8_9GAMM|nr:zf-HC2 domain-containing protein [Nitrosococcus wardiae]QBQ54326.1 zf-HC2 domain-containing protein [Nitrosococcus wardiae]